jgi:hypothetical protein
MIVLWQFEECEHSQPVRQLMTQLGVDFVAISAPSGHPEKDGVMERLFGNSETPALWDTRTGVLLQGTTAICRYLESSYSLPAAEDLDAIGE